MEITLGAEPIKENPKAGILLTTMNEDLIEYVRKCHKFQMLSKIPRAAPNELTQMQSPWPFAVWGIDLIGKLPTGGEESNLLL